MRGERLKILRESRKLTQKQLGKLVNLSQQTIDHYEKGRAEPKGDTLNLLAQIFNISTDYLLGTSNIMSLSLETKDIEPAEINLKDAVLSLENLVKQAVANGVSPKDVHDSLRYSEKLLSALQDAKTKGGNKK